MGTIIFESRVQPCLFRRHAKLYAKFALEHCLAASGILERGCVYRDWRQGLEDEEGFLLSEAR